MPSKVQGKDRKLARPYHGPYRVLNVTPTNAEVTLIDRPRNPSIFVSLTRVRRCYDDMDDHSWTGGDKKSRKRPQQEVSVQEVPVPPPAAENLDESSDENTPPEPPEPSPSKESVSQNTRARTRSRKKSPEVK